MRWVLYFGLTAGAAVPLIGCDDAPRARDEQETVDAAVIADTGAAADTGFSDGATPDGAPADDAGGPMPDADPPPDFGPEADLGPIEEELCNGEDDDRDGLIDEEVANVCGGCGPVPPEGCQAWQIAMVQSESGTVSPYRIVGLLGGAIGTSERQVENADCQVLRSVGQHPDGHIGLVDITSETTSLSLVPAFDAVSGSHRYTPNPEPPGNVRVHTGGDLVQASAGGGRSVPAFEVQVDAPAALTGITGAELEGLTARARAEENGPFELSWDRAASDQRGELDLFVGGSVPVFTNVFYRAIRHYQLQLFLADDGSYTLPAELLPGVPESAVWARLTRSNAVRKPLGPHVVEMIAGNRVEARQAGRLDTDDPPPFQITQPSPNERVIVPGEDLPIEWGVLPEGDGPLVVSLTTYDSANTSGQQIICVVDDPGLGRIVLPGDLTEVWPSAEDDLRQISARWGVRNVEIEGANSGSYTESISVLLRLEP